MKKIKSTYQNFLDMFKSHYNLIHFTFLKLLGEGIVFLFPILIAKFVSPQTYGSYTLGMMIIFFSTTLILGSSMTPFIISANKEMKKQKSISKSFTSQLIFFASSLGLIALIFILFNPFITDFIHINTTLLVYLYLAFIGISIKSLLGNYFLGLDKKTEHTKIGIYYGLSLLAFLFILDFNLQHLFLNYFISSIIILIISLPKINFREIFPLKYDKKMFAEHWNFTKWQMFGLTAVYFINWGDSIIINYFLTVADVGVYNLAYQIFKGIISFMYIINTFYLPELSKNIDKKEFISKYLYKSRIQLFSIATLSVILLILISPFVLNNFFSEGYSQASFLLQILLFGVIFKFWSIFYNPLYNVLKKYKYLQSMNIVQIIINIILGVALVIPFGLVGVAFGTTLSYFIRTAIDEAYFQIKVKKVLFEKKKKN